MKETNREENGTVMTRRKLLQTAGMTGAAMIAGYGMSSLLNPTPAMATVSNRNFVAVSTSAEAQDVIDNSEDNLYLNNVAISDMIVVSRSIVILGGPTPSKPVVNLGDTTPCIRITAPEDASVVLISVKIDGDRANQTAPVGGDGLKNGLHVVSKCSIYALNCEFNNNMTDGLDYNPGITAPRNTWCVFENCSFLGNRRQGTSIINGDKVHFKNCRFNDTSGTAPSAGVDIEPASGTQYLGLIVFEDCEFNGNAGHGLEINGKSSSTQGDIRVIRCRMFGNLASDKQAFYLGTIAPTGTLITYKNVSIDGLNTDAGIKGSHARVHVKQFVLNNVHFETTTAANTIFLGYADRALLSNISWEQNVAGWRPWQFTSIGELHINRCQLPPGTFTAVDGSNGVGNYLTDVQYAYINDCSSWRVGHILVTSVQSGTNRGVFKMRGCNIQTGDGNNFRCLDIQNSDIMLYENHFPQDSESELLAHGASLVWVVDNRFEATAPNLYLQDTSAYKRVKGNVNLADI